MKLTTVFTALCLFACVLGSRVLSSSQVERQNWPKYVSKEGGFEFAAAGEVKEKTSGNIRTVEASVSLGNVWTYTARAAFFPVSMGRREDTEEMFSKTSQRLSSCTDLHVEKSEVQGLPARRFHDKCGNVRHLGLWVFAGNRIFTVDANMSPLAHSEDLERLIASFKITDPRFIRSGEWTSFEYPEGGFSVSLPGFPVRRAQSGTGGTGYFLENYAYAVSSLPARSGKASDILDRMENGAQMLVQGTVTKRSDTTHESLSARTFDVSYQDSKGRFLESCFVILGQERDYILTVLSKQDNPIPQSDINRFFSSFQEIKTPH